MLRLVPPAGTKVTLPELTRTCVRTLLSQASAADAVTMLRARIGARHVIPVGSGRTALYIILRALHSLNPERDVVAIPAYTCFSVAAAVVRAGLRIQLVDIDPQSLDFDYRTLESVGGDRLLAVVSSQLFGFIGDSERLRAVASSKGARLIEDAAQAFGSSANGSVAGSLGDVGFFSVGRGKPLFGMSGGFITTDSDPIRNAMEPFVERLTKPNWGRSAKELLQLGGYFAFFDPVLYRVADSVPFLNLGATIFDPEYALEQMSSVARNAIADNLARTKDMTCMRGQTAAAIKRAVGVTPGFRFPEPAVPCMPAYPRLPVIAESRNLRDRAIAALRQRGIGASPFYPTAICDIPGISAYVVDEPVHCTAAHTIAATLLTLPTHSLVKERDIANIAETLHALSGNRDEQ